MKALTWWHAIVLMNAYGYDFVRKSQIEMIDALQARVRELESLTTIEDFVREVEARAEQKMLMTGKLEGAHYAAMKQLLAERQALKGGA